jgi:hypothetical protein
MIYLKEEYIERNDRNYSIKGRVTSLPAFQNIEDQDISLNISNKFDAYFVWL